MKRCPECNRTFSNDDMFCDICGVKLDNMETVVIAEPESEEPEKKKKGLLWWHILLIVLSIIVAGAVFCVVHFAGKDDKGNVNEEENISQEDDTEESDGDNENNNAVNDDNTESESETVIIDTPVTDPEVTTKDSGTSSDKNENKPDTPDNGNSNRPGQSAPVTDVKPSTVDAFIDAFMAGKFYMATYDLQSGEKEKASIAKDGKNFQMSIEAEGLQMQILVLNGNTYLVNQNNKYIDLASLTEFIGEDTFDTESITNMIDMLDVTQYDFKKVETGVAEIDGESVNYKKHVADNAELCFYYSSGKIKQIELVTDDDATGFAFAIDEYSASIPSGMLTLSGLTESNLFEFVFEMMQ